MGEQFLYVSHNSLVIICTHFILCIILLFVLFQTETRVGLYVEFLQDWFSVFPREQFIIQTLEDYHNNRSAVLNKIFKHIGIGMYSAIFHLLTILMALIAFIDNIFLTVVCESNVLFTRLSCFTTDFSIWL